MLKTKDSNTFVFSPRLDLLAFYLPLFIGLAAHKIIDSDTWPAIFLFSAVGVWFSDAGHVFATTIPALLDSRNSARFRFFLWVAPICVIGSWLALSWYNDRLFEALFGYFAIYHVVMQQYGWMNILVRKELSVATWERRFDRVVFWTIYLVPIFYWHTDLSLLKKGYLFQNNFIINAPSSWWPWLFNLHWLIISLALCKIVYDITMRRLLQIGKIFFILYSIIWFYGGLVIAQNNSFFIAVLLLTHGTAYNIYMHVYWRRDGAKYMKSWFTKDTLIKFAAFTIFIIIASRSWYIFKPYFDLRIGLPIYWIPLMAHHTLDSMIWRRSITKLSPA